MHHWNEKNSRILWDRVTGGWSCTSTVDSSGTRWFPCSDQGPHLYQRLPSAEAATLPLRRRRLVLLGVGGRRRGRGGRLHFRCSGAMRPVVRERERTVVYGTPPILWSEVVRFRERAGCVLAGVQLGVRSCHKWRGFWFAFHS